MVDQLTVDQLVGGIEVSLVEQLPEHESSDSLVLL